MPRASRSALSAVYRRLSVLYALLIAVMLFAPGATASAAPAQPKSATKPMTKTAPTKRRTPVVSPAKSGAAPAAKTVPAEPATKNPATKNPATKNPATKNPAVDTGRRETEIYGDRLDGLQREVDDLKDRIFRSKARLSLLKETVLHGVLAGSRVIVAHRNVMGSQFRLVKVAVILDGAQIYARNDTSEQGGSLDQEDELVVFDGNLVPGPHSVTVELTYRGHGFGMFSYLNNYTFDSRSSHSFIAPENGAVRVLSVGFESGNLTTEMKDRPSVDWQEIPLDASGQPLPKNAGRKKKGGRTKATKTTKTKNAASAKTSGSAGANKSGDASVSPKSTPKTTPAASKPKASDQ